MKSYSDNDSCQSLQPPLVLPRRITHPNLPQGKEQVTLPMNFSPLSFSPVGEMQVTLVLSKTSSVNELQPPLVLPRWGDAGYSELSKTGWFRLKTCWCWLLLLMCQTFHFIGIFVQFWARCLPTWGKHVAQHGKARCPTWARLLHGCCPFVPNMADSVRA